MKTMFIMDDQHKRITERSKTETEKRGKFISLSDVLEELVDIGFAEIDRREEVKVDENCQEGGLK
jgi:hypothetical protein